MPWEKQALRDKRERGFEVGLGVRIATGGDAADEGGGNCRISAQRAASFVIAPN